MKKVIGVLAIVMFILSAMAIGKAVAFEQITAQEAYDMVAADTAKLIDVRTTPEYVWVGTCKLPDGTTPYNIPWQIWAYQFSETDGKVKAGGIVVKTIFGTLIEKTFPDKTTPLILFCRSGHRSTYGAEYLETLGYTDVYEIDNPLKEVEDYPGGSGGFQGSSGVDPNEKGYRGYPERLPGPGPGVTLEIDKGEIDNKNDSVSWMDTGLPMTQTVDKDKIWLYMWD